MCEKKMKDDCRYLHKQVGMQVGRLGKQETILIHTTVMSYTWQALWKKAENWQC